MTPVRKPVRFLAGEILDDKPIKQKIEWQAVPAINNSPATGAVSHSPSSRGLKPKDDNLVDLAADDIRNAAGAAPAREQE
jgi:hypothetical protein